MALVAGSAEHCPFEGGALELRGNGHVVLLAGDGVTHGDLCLPIDVSAKETAVSRI